MEIELDELNFVCEAHKSPIGGVCSDLFCTGVPLLCIMCATEEGSCLRQQNHEMVTFEEFFLQIKSSMRDMKLGSTQLTLGEMLNIVKKVKLDKIKQDVENQFKEFERKKNALIFELIERSKEHDVPSFIKNYNKKAEGFFDNKISIYQDKLEELRSKGFILLEDEGVEGIYREFQAIRETFAEMGKAKTALDKIFSSGTAEKTKLRSDDVFMEDVRQEESEPDLEQEIITPTSVKDNAGVYDFLNKLVTLTKYVAENEMNIAQLSANIKHFLEVVSRISSDELKFDDKIKEFEPIAEQAKQTLAQLTESALGFLEQRKPVEGYVALNKFLQEHNARWKFAYGSSDFNTSCKFDLCNVHPSKLTQSLVLARDFERNSIPGDTLCLATTSDNELYMIYSGVEKHLKIKRVGHKLDEQEDISPKQSHSGLIKKVEHYQSCGGQDYLIVLSLNKCFDLYRYSTSTKYFVLCTSFNAPSTVCTFEIIEKEGVGYLFLPLFNSNLRRYTLPSCTVWKNFQLHLTQIYNLKAFYHKSLDKYLLLASSQKSVLLIDAFECSVYATFSSHANASLMNTVLLSKGNPDNWKIISNNQKCVAVFDLNEPNKAPIIREETFSTYLTVELWNEYYAAVCDKEGNIRFFDITKEGGQGVNIKAQNEKVLCLKRFYSDALGEVLLSASADGTVKAWQEEM